MPFYMNDYKSLMKRLNKAFLNEKDQIINIHEFIDLVMPTDFISPSYTSL